MLKIIIEAVEEFPFLVDELPRPLAERVIDLGILKDNELREAESEWHSDFPKRRAILKAMRDEQPEEAKRARLRYLNQQLRSARQRLNDQHEMYVWASRDGASKEALQELIDGGVRIRKEVKEYESAIHALRHNDEGITDDMIAMAREYPISRIITVNNRGFAKCLWHEEDTPSMYTKGNYVHCFGCGKSGDSIDVYRELNGCGFKEAVLALQ
jgi:hypothetical protein